MPRERRQDGFDVLIDLLAAFPSWIAFVAAGFIAVAMPPIARRMIPNEETASMVVSLSLPAAFVVAVLGAAVIVEKKRRSKLVSRSRSLEALRALSWREFEQLTAEAYRRQGYSVAETTAGADGGVDLVLRNGRDTVFVQCKHYRTRQVSVRPVRELLGVMAAEGASKGIFICSGTYTREAKRFAEGRIELIDGEALLTLLHPVTDAAGQPREQPVVGTASPTIEPLPRCHCGSEMLLRRNRRTGDPFYGCSRFPVCRGTKPAAVQRDPL